MFVDAASCGGLQARQRSRVLFMVLKNIEEMAWSFVLVFWWKAVLQSMTNKMTCRGIMGMLKNRLFIFRKYLFKASILKNKMLFSIHITTYHLWFIFVTTDIVTATWVATFVSWLLFLQNSLTMWQAPCWLLEIQSHEDQGLALKQNTLREGGRHRNHWHLDKINAAQ